MTELLAQPPAEHLDEIIRRVELGLQHEQQHQELLLMDIKHILAQNPLHPVYRADLRAAPKRAPQRRQWHDYAGGVVTIGHDATASRSTARRRAIARSSRISSSPSDW